jgi:hypothetical protein
MIILFECILLYNFVLIFQSILKQSKMTSNLASITKLKTGQINANSMGYLKDKNQIFIANQKGLVVYDIKSAKF